MENYTTTLACNQGSQPFSVIFFFNHVAASQTLGYIIDAIVDCSQAIALDPNYPKVISWRATLHECVRYYGVRSLYY